MPLRVLITLVGDTHSAVKPPSTQASLRVSLSQNTVFPREQKVICLSLSPDMILRMECEHNENDAAAILKGFSEVQQRCFSAGASPMGCTLLAADGNHSSACRAHRNQLLPEVLVLLTAALHFSGFIFFAQLVDTHRLCTHGVQAFSAPTSLGREITQA